VAKTSGCYAPPVEAAQIFSLIICLTNGSLRPYPSSSRVGQGASNDQIKYREKAEYCRQMAAKVISPIDRDSWLKLAADWLLMLRPRLPSQAQTEGAFDAQAEAQGTQQKPSEPSH
jgi:hypothetical protein